MVLRGQSPAVDGLHNLTLISMQCGQQIPSSHCGAGMLFAVNPDQTSMRNYTAFQQLAEQLNGTATTTATAAGSSHTGAAAPSMRISSVAGVLLAFGAMLAYLL